MTSDIDVGNDSLRCIGCSANITALVPPDNSVEAQDCASTLPKSKAMVLEMHNWNFASRNVLLAPVVLTVSNVNIGDNKLTTPTAHGLGANDPIQFVGDDLPAPLVEDTTYYVVDTAQSTAFKVTDAIDGDALDITTAGSGTIEIEKGSDRPDWLYAYAAPGDCVRALVVVQQGTRMGGFRLPTVRPLDAFTSGYASQREIVTPGFKIEMPPFVYETNRGDERVVYTDVPTPAVLHYTWLNLNLLSWSPLAIEVLTLVNASKLAGSLLRGADGMRTRRELLQEAFATLAQATGSDSNQRNLPIDNVPDWDAAR